jgi:uncharacterized protein DUF3536/glycosyl hydrolase family 57
VTASSRGRLVVHGHFYQPLRVDPFSGRITPEPPAAPYHDWNARIEAECYRPIGDRGTLSRTSFNLGPTLAAWMAAEAPDTLRKFVAGDRWQPVAREEPPLGQPNHGNAMAQAFHHSILPLASASDRRTEIRWGLREFLLRFGRAAEGMWLPETAVDLPTLRILAEEGVRYTILAPWQAAETNLDNRRPYRVELGGGRSIVVALYDSGLSGAVSFEPAATADADRFARERVATRLAGTPSSDGEPGLVVIATDGELYGHHQPFRDLFLHRLVAPGPGVPDRGFDVVQLATALLEPPGRAHRAIRIAERTSWSCHHGVARWSTECPDADDGRWKAPLRGALDRLAGAIDAATDSILARLPGAPDRIAAREAFVDVVVGVQPEAAFTARWLGDEAAASDRKSFLGLLDAQRWRLAMFASDGWFWDDPVRPETRQNLRCAARAVRLVDEIAGTRLERALVADLTLLVSPGQGLDGAAIYRAALSEVGQPGPAA